MAGSRKASSDTRKGNGSLSHRVETSGKIVGISKKATIAPGMIYGRKTIHPIRDGINSGGVLGKVLGKNRFILLLASTGFLQISTEMEEDLEDSDVLKILHKDMLDSVVTSTNSLSPSLDGCSSGPSEGQIYSDDLGNGVVGPPPP
ncbi:hypothetical protein Q3G72_010829 [Acer saccharum]|nr:hypothetical protein Q3G72_010829 [Acer saccharum]